MDTENNTLNCVLLPMFGEQYLLLPAISIVEVVNSKGLDIVVDPQGGLIGKIQWQGWNVPLVSFEAASKGSVPRFNMETKTCILHSLSDDNRMPYLAFTVQGNVQKVGLTESRIKPYSFERESPLIKSVVEIESQVAIIPDLDEVVDYIRQRV